MNRSPSESSFELVDEEQPEQPEQEEQQEPVTVMLAEPAEEKGSRNNVASRMEMFNAEQEALPLPKLYTLERLQTDGMKVKCYAGIFYVQVTAGSAAERSGLPNNHMLLGVNGHPVRPTACVKDVMNFIKSDRTVSLLMVDARAFWFKYQFVENAEEVNLTPTALKELCDGVWRRSDLKGVNRQLIKNGFSLRHRLRTLFSTIRFEYDAEAGRLTKWNEFSGRKFVEETLEVCGDTNRPNRFEVYSNDEHRLMTCCYSDSPFFMFTQGKWEEYASYKRARGKRDFFHILRSLITF